MYDLPVDEHHSFELVFVQRLQDTVQLFVHQDIDLVLNLQGTSCLFHLTAYDLVFAHLANDQDIAHMRRALRLGHEL